MRDTGLFTPVRAGQIITSHLDDDAWVTAMLDAEIALARAQSRVGMIPETAAAAITTVARQHRFDVAALAVASRGAANPVVALVEELTAAVAATDPELANYVHRGSTSQDILDTATMLITTRACRAVLTDLDHIAAALASTARRHRDTPMAGRTLGMHAVPTTFGAKTAAWLSAVLDARDRIAPLAHGALPVQLGGAAGTLAAYLQSARSSIHAGADIDTRQLCGALTTEFAAELSLTAPAVPWHTNRTPIVDIVAALVATCGALGKIAIDVMDLSRTEIAELSEPVAAGRGESSAMPQKRNPTLSTLIRSAALQIPAPASTLHLCLLAEHERPAGAWHSEWQPLRDCLLLVGGAAATAVELTGGLIVDPDRMRANLALTNGQIVSERTTAVLTPLLGKKLAKTRLQAAAFDAAATARPLTAILAADPEIRRHLSIEDIECLLRPQDYLGAAPTIVDLVLQRHDRTLAAPGIDHAATSTTP
ncbi:class-II fumarase/aspartase family protein [Nocardia arizonensis]|nr:adenylosuccinate lyase family protein [Nocardia arizonensis]